MASSERVFDLLDTPVDEQLGAPEVAAQAPQPAGVAAATSAQPLKPSAVANPRVEFRNVWFAYKGEEWVLRDVSLTIEPGEMVAIVGHTGAGKTTLISLLLRFYDVQKGTIQVGGRDIREWPIHELRRQFGVVLQDPYVFSGTIESNIRLRNPAVSDERLRQVVREVNLETFVSSLAQGLEEPVIERGASLSSGQKQLLSFARALAFNPRFLILDEATSSVDTDTEFKIREALSRMLTGHTSIVIAHRLSTVQKANRIVVMHKGQVRETGSHQELLAQRGIYYKLYQLQYQDQELQTGEPGTVAAALVVQHEATQPQATELQAGPPQPETAVEIGALDGVSRQQRPPEAVQRTAAVNGTEQHAPAETHPSSASNPAQAAPAKGGGKRRRGKRPAPADESQKPDGLAKRQLSLSLDATDGRSAEVAPKGPASSPTLVVPEAKQRRRRGKRRKKDAPK
jgi:ABC-type multidrug transport system ATPase subunit